MKNRLNNMGIGTDYTVTFEPKECKNDSKPIDKYFFSFIDILGFSKLIENNQNMLQDIYESMIRTIRNLPDVHLTGDPNKSYEPAIKPTKSREIELPKFVPRILKENYTNFSDTIIFYIAVGNDEEENIERFRSICWTSNEFIAKSILKPNKPIFEIPLRCGIAYGDALIEDNVNVHIGQPLINAYRLSECQEWVGGAIHNSVPAKYIESTIGYNKELYEYKVPIKEGKDIFSKYALNWVKHHYTVENHNSIRYKTYRDGPTLRDLGYHVRQHDWGSESVKRENTLDFIEKIDRAWNEAYEVEKSTEVTEWMKSTWPKKYKNSK